jgi:mono/diheme cytochrome c family protein
MRKLGTTTMTLANRYSSAMRSGLWSLVLSFVYAAGFAASSHSQQSSAPAPDSPATLNVQQRAGRILFMQNCAFCHLPYRTEDKTGKSTASIGPKLKGLMQGEKPLSEDAVRKMVENGIPQKMPAFRYGLAAKEIEQIMAYLKVY